MADRTYINDPIQFKIDNDLRIITIPSDGVVLGVANDKNTNRVNFSMPRYYNGFDMSLFNFRINYVNAAGQASFYDVIDLTVQNEELRFTWLVDLPATIYVGDVSFVVRVFKMSGDAVVQQYSTTIGKCKVLEGITVDVQIDPEEIIDILANVKKTIDDYTDVKKQELDDILAAALTYKGAYTGSDLNDLSGPIGIYSVLSVSNGPHDPLRDTDLRRGIVVVIPSSEWGTTRQIFIDPTTGDLYYRNGNTTVTPTSWFNWFKQVDIIRDGTNSEVYSWSSTKIAQEIASIIKDTETSNSYTWSSEKITASIENIITQQPISDFVNRFKNSKAILGPAEALANGYYIVPNSALGYPSVNDARIELTGDESWNTSIYGYYMSDLTYNAPSARTRAFDTHDLRFTTSGSNLYCGNTTDYTSVDAFKAYLRAQKASGTPVVVYYKTASPMPTAGSVVTEQLSENTYIQKYTHAQTLYTYKRLATYNPSTSAVTSSAWERYPTLAEVNAPCRLG